MNNNKLKIKYIVNSFKESSDYPTTEDLLFIMNKYCEEKNKKTITNKIIEKESSLDEITLNNLLIDLEQNKFIKLIKEKEDTKTYEIINFIFD